MYDLYARRDDGACTFQDRRSSDTWQRQQHVKVKPMQLVMPPSPLVALEAVVRMAVYSARAMLQGKATMSGK